MPLDAAAVRRIARLARIGVDEEEVDRLQAELGAILGWVEQLSEVDVEGVAPMVGVGQQALRWRRDEVTEGDTAQAVLEGAPERVGAYFAVPKVVE